MKRTILLGLVLTWMSTACGIPASTPATATPLPSTFTPQPATATVVSPTVTPVPTAMAPQLILSIKGDPNPLNGPTDLALDSQDNLYVVDGLNNRIQVFDSTGNFLAMWGSEGTGPSEFNFIDIENHFADGGVAVDEEGNIYVSDETNRNQKFRLTDK